MLNKIFNIPNLTLVVALALSSIAAWYSVLGLTTIFAGAVIPIIVMGTVLEIAKIVTTVWLHKYWINVKFLMKLYMTSAVIVLSLLTSMGIFGLLSKSHSDQNTITGNNSIMISELDRQIEIEKRTIKDSEVVISQLDQAVQSLIDANRIRGSSGSIAVRKSQTEERNSLNTIIANANAKIIELETKKIPLMQEKLNLEAKVGPIKYIAALIYGDNPDDKTLERSVRYVIILLVLVFDPLAIALVIASNASRKWDVKTIDNPKKTIIEKEKVEPTLIDNMETKIDPVFSNNIDEFDISKHPYLFKKPSSYHPPGVTPVGPVVYNDKVDDTINCRMCDTKLVMVPKIGYFCPNTKCSSVVKLEEPSNEPIVKKENTLLKDLPKVNSSFGTSFPKRPKRGDLFVKVDVLPNKVFKYEGNRWIEINKTISDSYIMNDDYIRYLIDKLNNHEYDVELLTENEKDQIRIYLKANNKNLLDSNLI